MDKQQLQNLETQYLKAKVAYYEGFPIMSDAAFDVIEKSLREEGSKVIEQVGTKRKDFDFPHPTPMLSLAKIQTEQVNGITNYQTEAFNKWFNNVYNYVFLQTFNKITKLYASPKFDGNAINIIYRHGKLQSVLTRSSKEYGKDITDRFKMHLPENIVFEKFGNFDVIEIRCECVIDRKIFAEKYAAEFANARNFVAGVLGKDEYSLKKVADLTLIPVAYIIDGVQTDLSYIPEKMFGETFQMVIHPEDYEDTIKYMEKLREDFEFLLDGVVIAVPAEYRAILGENDHDPEWAIAIKFVPDEVVTEVLGIERNIGKTGELTPVVLLKPVELAGTTVKRASGYNEGYIINNKIGVGSFVTIAKAGDIIPEIQAVVVESIQPFHAPIECPCCGDALTFDGIHLMCPNPFCEAVIAKKLSYAVDMLDLKRIGGRTIEPFAKDFNNMFELMYTILNPFINYMMDYEKYGIKRGSRSHQIFYDAFNNIRSLKYSQVILMMCYDGVGRKLSEQVAREYCGLKPDYTSMERALVAKFQEPDVKAYIMYAVSELENLGIVIDIPKDSAIDTTSIKVCMTGSPGSKTKEEFISQFSNIEEVSITDKNCQYLITNSISSETNKTKIAKKKNITIITYEDFKNKMNSL